MFKIVDGQRIPLNDAEIAAREAHEKELAAQMPDRMRESRNAMLLRSDWTHTSDHDSGLTAEKKTEWATYRQALRDAPSHKEWPNMLAHWPTQPE